MMGTVRFFQSREAAPSWDGNLEESFFKTASKVGLFVISALSVISGCAFLGVIGPEVGSFIAACVGIGAFLYLCGGSLIEGQRSSSIDFSSVGSHHRNQVYHSPGRAGLNVRRDSFSVGRFIEGVPSPVHRTVSAPDAPRRGSFRRDSLGMGIRACGRGSLWEGGHEHREGVGSRSVGSDSLFAPPPVSNNVGRGNFSVGSIRVDSNAEVFPYNTEGRAEVGSALQRENKSGFSEGRAPVGSNNR